MPNGKSVTFRIEGNTTLGFVYKAQTESKAVQEISGSQEELTREEVESLFIDYVAGSVPNP
jgi:hypothetical protein